MLCGLMVSQKQIIQPGSPEKVIPDQSDLPPLRDISIEIVVPGPVVPNNAVAPAVPNNAADPQMNGQLSSESEPITWTFGTSVWGKCFWNVRASAGLQIEETPWSGDCRAWSQLWVDSPSEFRLDSVVSFDWSFPHHRTTLPAWQSCKITCLGHLQSVWSCYNRKIHCSNNPICTSSGEKHQLSKTSKILRIGIVSSLSLFCQISTNTLIYLPHLIIL